EAGMPSITDGVERFSRATTGEAFEGFFWAALRTWCLTGCSGLITGTAAGALEPCPSSKNPAPRAITAVTPAAARIRVRRLTMALSAVVACRLNLRRRLRCRLRGRAGFAGAAGQKKGRGLPRPFESDQSAS